MPGQDQQTTNQAQSSVSAPWAPAQPRLLDLLNKYGGLNTDVTSGQKSALDNLTTAASGIPNFGESSSDAIRKLFSSNTDPQVGMLSDAYNRFKTNLTPTAAGAELDPYATPGLSDAIARMTKDITNSTKAVYAGSGRDPSGAGSFAGSLGRGLTEGIAPVIANQFNVNSARRDAANNALLTGAGTTAGGITGQQQVPLQNLASAIGLLPSAATSYTAPGATALGAANAAYSQPFANLQQILGPIAGIAGLGGQSSGTGTSTTVQPQNTLSNILGAGASTIGLLSLLSDERAKTDVEQIGMLHDGQKVVRFRYKGDAPMRIGLLAQEVEDYAPDAVHNIGGMLHVDHRRATDRAAHMHSYAAGGFPKVGQPAMVGENGPEVFVPQEPGQIVPNEDVPLFMQSGRMPVPRDALPTDPNERAMLTMQRSVRPPMGRGEVEGRPIQMMAAAAGGVPASLALKGIAAAPKLSAGVLSGLGFMGSTSEAGEQPFIWNDPNQERSREIARINREIEVETGRVTKSAPGTQKARIDSLVAERQPLMDARQKENDAAFVRWQAEQAAKSQAERPFREEYPTAYRMLPLAGWGGSVLGGLLGARGGSPVKSFIGGALGGVPLSAAAAIGPTAYDAATLPTGSKHQMEASGWLHDLDNYWLGRVAPEVGVGALLGGTAGKYGSQIGERISRAFRRSPGSPPAMPSTAAPAGAPLASPAARSYEGAYFDNAGRLRVGGRYVPMSSPMSLAP